jgi:hypothetical protein
MKKTALITSLAALAVAAPAAQADTYLCVPATAGAAVTSGGGSGTCATGSTAVQMPSSATDQQTLISVLPYLSFNAAGIGGKPTIVVRGANLRMMRATTSTSTTTGDGTGNIVLGGPSWNYTDASAITGSENLISGFAHRVSGNNDIVVGQQNTVQASADLVGGALNTTVPGGDSSALFGYSNKISGLASALLGGGYNTVSGRYSTLDGGSNRTMAQSFGGGEDVQQVTYAGDGTIRSRSRSDIQVYHSSTGANWIYDPGAKLKTCSVTATPGDATDPNLVARRVYDQSYDEWAYIATSSGGVAKDATVNVTIACPTI